MAKNSPKHIAFKILFIHKYYSLNNYDDLQNIIESKQFTIIEYKKHANFAPVSELITRLRVEKEVEQNDSFIYINNNLKFLFINEDISDEDKCSLLRHELGHICDPNIKTSYVHYSKIQREEFANEFSHYIKNPGIRFKLKLLIRKKRKLLVSIIALIACVLGLFVTINPLITKQTKSATSNTSTHEIFDKTYYVTSAGKKYHRKHCIIIRYKNNLTEIKLNDAINDGYKPCMICNPEE